MSSDEHKPLLAHLNTKDRTAIEEMENIGATGNGNFAPALQYSVRTSVWMCLLATIVWVPAIGAVFPVQIVSRVPLLICLFTFTVNPLIGQAINNAFCGINGTFWACFHMWVMNGIFPGGMKEGMSPTSATAIFGWANFLIFLFITLWCKCGMGTKMFYLATFIGFMLAFLDPKSTVPFSENFTISSKGTAVNTLISVALGTLAAPLMNLLPYPMSFATSKMKDASVTASKNTAKLFEAIIVYYGGSESSVIVESIGKHAIDLRGELDGLGGAIGCAFWEGLDLGVRGTVRGLMEAHVGLMNNVYDRLRAILTVVQTEDFGPSHIAIMDKIRDSSVKVALATTALMVAVTEAATDGDISSKEKAELKSLVSDAKAAVKLLAKDFDAARKDHPPVSTDMLGENYFVLTISAYARLVIEYTDMMMTDPPKGSGLGAAIVGGITSTWDIGAMMDRFNINFTIVHFLAITFCWLWALYVDNFGGGCVITSVFLMTTNVCPDIQGFCNVINAVILSVMAGTLVYQWSCGSGFGDYLLPFLALILWTGSLYGYFSGSVFLLPCLLFAALSPFKWVTRCPTGEIAAGARGLWAGMVSTILAIAFVCTFQFFLAIDRANNLATKALDDAFNGLKDSFDAFWKHNDATEPMAGVPGNCGAGTGYCGSAAIEPRLWRNPWKKGLYMEVIGHVQQIRLDILMMWFACAGSDGKPDGIFKKFEASKNWGPAKQDLNTTLADAHMLALGILSHESGHFDGLSKLKVTTGIDTLDNLPDLVKDMNSALKFPAEAPETMEDDELCQISTVCMLLESTIQHMAVLLKGTIRQA